ncbi:mandelate racemase/muconate lactonizing enzyme family protein, partial [Halorubrum sp. SP9]
MRDYSDQIDTRDPDRDVQITGLDACVVEGNFEWNLIKVETDAGVTGIG